MIQQNATLNKEGRSYFIKLSSPELEELYLKFQGLVSVKIGKPDKPGTNEQNRAMHSLLSAYYTTGMHSAPEGYTLSQFKVFMKLQYGPVYEMEHKGQLIKIPKSWSDYSKQERVEFIDGLISEINQSGAYAESEKIREIIEGMSINQ
jgi:hypothetical protein